MRSLVYLMIVSTLFSQSLFAKEYLVVGIAGFGTTRSETLRESGAHSHLPREGSIYARLLLTHHNRPQEFDFIMDLLQCSKGEKLNKDVGLIIMINSWGATKGYKLAKAYKESCGEDVDAYYSVDGVAKIIGPFVKKPAAKKCFNYYQTRGLIKGGFISGCTNYNVTPYCDPKRGGLRCHITTEYYGTLWSADHMEENYLLD